jgi:Tol biopolymer transport system component
MVGNSFPGRRAQVLRWVLSVSMLLTFFSSELHSQYFGRNKVQYDDFDFRYIQTENFDIYYYPEKEETIMDIGRMTERWYHRLSMFFNHEFRDRKPIIFYADDADFQQTNVIQSILTEGVGGVTEGLKNRIVMPIAGNYADTDHVLGHELVHVFQYDIAQYDTGRFNFRNIPLWFIEGMAEYLSVGRDDPHTAMWLRDAIREDKFPTVRDMTRDPGRYFPYRFGHAFWVFVGGTYGDDVIPEMYREAGRRGVGPAIEVVLGVTPDSLSTLWKEQTIREYEPFMQGRSKPAETGQRVLARDIDAGDVNIGPAISPDGRYVAFLSERELFGIDLFLADAYSGEVQNKLVSASTDRHFDALRFINSSGAWSPDGKQLAFIVFQQGRNRIALLDVDSRHVTERMEVDGVGTISNLTWSPDGSRIAFAGMSNGRSNLYTIDIATTEVTMLTEDRYAVHHPVWSPDGNKIAFITDRTEGTEFDLLKYDTKQIAFYHLDDGSISLLRIFANTLHTNPQFSRDGSKLYFIANPDGFSNIYRMDLESEDVERVTNVVTGITGITLLSPALTIARETGRMMFAVFEGGLYTVYALDEDEIDAIPVDIETIRETYAGFIPPAESQGKNIVDNYLNDPEGGLITDREFSTSKYSPRLQLDYIGTTGIGIAVSSFGTYFMGGASLYWSDMLGNHNLLTAVEAQGTWKDIGGGIAYSNLTHRTNWGVQLSRMPIPFGRYYISFPEENMLRQHLRIERWIFNSISGAIRHPLSMTRRFEISGGYTRLGFDIEERQFTFMNGIPISAERVTLDAPPGLNLYQGSVAYVGDNSFFGFTSPVRGQRYRLQIGGTTGSLQFYDLLADYRRYEMPFRPLTLAMRTLHYGRYGKDSESERMSPIYLGQPTYIRGYNIYSMTLPEFRQLEHLLSGSRIAVINLEARVPLFGVDRYGLINFPFVPTELSLFFDGGIAWSSDRSPTLNIAQFSEEQIPVFSTGISARLNLLGALIMEVYYVYPFQRPERGAHFGFQISPGW